MYYCTYYFNPTIIIRRYNNAIFVFLHKNYIYACFTFQGLVHHSLSHSGSKHWFCIFTLHSHEFQPNFCALKPVLVYQQFVRSKMLCTPFFNQNFKCFKKEVCGNICSPLATSWLSHRRSCDPRKLIINYYCTHQTHDKQLLHPHASI